MKTLIINGQEVDQKEISEKVFGSFMLKLTKFVARERHVICSLKVDGTALSEEEEKELTHTPISALQSIEITTADPLDLSLDTLDSVSEYIDKILPKLSSCAALYEAGAHYHADPKFVEVLKAMETMTEVLNNVIITLKLSDDSYIKLLQEDLFSALKTVLTLKKQNAWQLVGDTLKNDVLENLIEWKTKGIKHIKNRKSY